VEHGFSPHAQDENMQNLVATREKPFPLPQLYHPCKHTASSLAGSSLPPRNYEAALHLPKFYSHSFYLHPVKPDV